MDVTTSQNDVFDYMKTNYPNWIIGTCDKFEIDSLNLNWEKMCDAVNTHRKKILIVEFIYFQVDEKDTTCKGLCEICNILTQEGYCVRSKDHIQKCIGCNTAVLTEKMAMTMEKVFNEKCKTCRQKEVK